MQRFVAVANSGSNDVIILLGNGNGTSGTPISVGVGTGPNALAVGDFNGDRKLDLAVTNLASQTVSILLGNGDGTFRSGVSLPVIAAPYSIAVGDFNQDGKTDLAVAVAYQGSASTAAVNVVLVAQGNGDGTFQAWTTWQVAMGPSQIAIGDFNRVGHLDLVTAKLYHQRYLSTLRKWRWDISAGPKPGGRLFRFGAGGGGFQP